MWDITRCMTRPSPPRANCSTSAPGARIECGEPDDAVDLAVDARRERAAAD
jgi:hypothetical protein